MELSEAEEQIIELVRAAVEDGHGEVKITLRDSEIVSMERIIRYKVRNRKAIKA